MKKTKLYMALSILFIMFVAPLMVFAQVNLDPVSEVDFIGQLLALIGGYKGMASLAVAVAVVQLLIMFAKTPMAGKLFKGLTAQVKFLVVAGLTLISGYLALKVSGMPTGEAIMKTLSLPLLQEYVYQIYKQFFEKKP